jgi:hypothetical protein
MILPPILLLPIIMLRKNPHRITSLTQNKRSAQGLLLALKAFLKERLELELIFV